MKRGQILDKLSRTLLYSFILAKGTEVVYFTHLEKNEVKSFFLLFDKYMIVDKPDRYKIKLSLQARTGIIIIRQSVQPFLLLYFEKQNKTKIIFT